MDIRLSQADISDHSWDFPDLVKKESFDSTLIDERCAQRVDRSFLCFRDVNLQAAASRSVGRTFAFSGFFQRFVINHDRNDGCKHLCDPECVPHAIRTHKTGQKICGGHDNDHVAEKRNNKGLVPFPRPSMAPEVVTDTAEIRKPALMLFSALEPAAMVSG